MALDQQRLTPPETEPPMTIAGFNAVLLSVAATLCGLFTVLALSVRQIRSEARQTLLQALRLIGFSFGYLVIGLVYVPIRVLDCASRAWPSYSSSDSACDCDCDFDDDYYYSDEDGGEEEDEDSGCAVNRSGRRKIWLVDKKGGDDAGGDGYYENELCTTRRDSLLAGGRNGNYTAAASSNNYTRCNSDISDLDLNEASDLEKGVLSAWRNKTKPC